MARKTANSMQAAKPVAEVIELSSDSEPETAETKPQQILSFHKTPQEKSDLADDYEQPLLKVVGIKYKTNKTDKTEEQPQQDANSTPSGSKMTLRPRGTSSVKHKHVSIEIPLPSSSMLRKRAGGEDESGDESGHEVFKTPMERRHITFNDSDQEDFVTPSEAPRRNPLELQIDADAVKEKATKEEEESDEEDGEDEESDDEAPEAVSTRAAEAQTTKAAEAAAMAIEEQEAATRRKRQERDAFLKQQAKERKQVRKPVAEADSDAELEEPTPAPVEKRKREVPKLLPLDLLESDDEEDMSHEADSATNNKRRKVNGVDALLREPKLPRDQRVGSTVYRVEVKRGNEKLAPKAKKQSINLKESLLIRGRQPQRKSGFFRR
ncbi:hypothetical protein QBC36DRAFT_335772 [Triangularia setosa]|uniref:Uncharacterized protein n=1 Tax=Triangularia setosa TaxID=2587417 RepID=A0AAN7A503_9PEZI|nr:hypothetical protein QBC36DRAFT_335772 [Podospora setosa]